MNLLLPFFLLLSTLNAHAAPPIFNDDGSTQAVLSGMHRGAWSDGPTVSVSADKNHPDKWSQDGKEYVQQNNMLCAYEALQIRSK